MGKATKWFRGLLGLKTTDSSSHSHSPTPRSNSCSKPPKKKWSFVKSSREKSHHQNNNNNNNNNSNNTPKTNERVPYDVSWEQNQFSGDPYSDDPGKHAIAVAAATAAVAEAAVAAAQAAAAVVRLTSSGRSTNTGTVGGSVNTSTTTAYVSANRGFGIREHCAAVKIQSHFRAYLARRALRALKALVKLQALVRGHIVRKQNADKLRRMQVLLRAQVRARVGRVQILDGQYSSTKSTRFHHAGPATPEKFEHAIRSMSTKQDQSLMLKRNGSKSSSRIVADQDKLHLACNWSDRRTDEGYWDRRGSLTRTDDEKSDKILEIDTGKPQFNPKRRNIFQTSHLSLGSDQISHSFTASMDSTAHQTVPSPSSCEVQSLSPLKFTENVEESSFCTAENSPQFFSASSSKKGLFTPTKSDGSRSCLSGFSDHPSYMSYTESSKAKIRSLSAPKQRPIQIEKSGSTKRYSINGYNDSKSSTQRGSALHDSFTSKAYPGSGRLDRLGMPVVVQGGDATGFSGGHWIRY